MNARSRSFLAAAVIAVAALGGAAYAQRSAPAEGTVIAGNGERIAGLDLSAFVHHDPERQMLELAYERVEHAYYRPVEGQLLIDGERKALTAFLKHKNVAAPDVPVAFATGDRIHDLGTIEQTLATTERRYAKIAPRDEFAQIAVLGMLSGLGDPYTTYLSPGEIRQLDEQLKGGNFSGIGVYIVQDKSGNVLVDPIEGNPAIRAGLRPGDTILAVDGHPATGQKLDEVERRIRGPKGSTVALLIRRHDTHEEKVIRVVRDDVHVPSVRAKLEGGIEYIRLADFGSSSAEEVRAALADGKQHDARGYILDLRNNGGGLLDAAVDISSLFVKSGPIVSTIDRAGRRDVRSATGHALDVAPVVVLVNKYTASASEITAGALQDYHAARIVGTRTFGKGVVQSLYTLPDRGALKITTARYVTPAGRDIQHKGINPDVVVDQRADLPIIDTAADKQLQAAKSIISRETASR